jgi:hypothetical protein
MTPSKRQRPRRRPETSTRIARPSPRSACANVLTSAWVATGPTWSCSPFGVVSRNSKVAGSCISSARRSPGHAGPTDPVICVLYHNLSQEMAVPGMSQPVEKRQIGGRGEAGVGLDTQICTRFHREIGPFQAREGPKPTAQAVFQQAGSFLGHRGGGWNCAACAVGLARLPYGFPIASPRSHVPPAKRAACQRQHTTAQAVSQQQTGQGAVRAAGGGVVLVLINTAIGQVRERITVTPGEPSNEQCGLCGLCGPQKSRPGPVRVPRPKPAAAARRLTLATGGAGGMGRAATGGKGG